MPEQMTAQQIEQELRACWNAGNDAEPPFRTIAQAMANLASIAHSLGIIAQHADKQPLFSPSTIEVQSIR